MSYISTARIVEGLILLIEELVGLPLANSVADIKVNPAIFARCCRVRDAQSMDMLVHFPPISLRQPQIVKIEKAIWSNLSLLHLLL